LTWGSSVVSPEALLDLLSDTGIVFGEIDMLSGSLMVRTACRFQPGAQLTNE
jgi:hypothetical protein